MAIVTTDSKHYTNIANAIREKTGITRQYKPSEMATGVQAAYSQVKQAEYDRFWDSYQDNGNRTHYRNGFAGHGWNDDTYNPKYPITGVNRGNGDLTGMFSYTKITDTKVPIVLKTTVANPGYTNLFYMAQSLVTIRSLELDGDFIHADSNFQYATKLKNITFAGSITQSGLNLSYCDNLTKESLINVIDCLADYSEDTSGTERIVTIGSTNYNKLTAEEVKIATSKGWTLI